MPSKSGNIPFVMPSLGRECQVTFRFRERTSSGNTLETTLVGFVTSVEQNTNGETIIALRNNYGYPIQPGIDSEEKKELTKKLPKIETRWEQLP